jgi:glycosyltransferase involved in cell wall biosynthesis
MKDLFIIGNEKISIVDKSFYSANIDFKTIIEGLKSNFNLIIFARKSFKKENFFINYKSIILSNNIFSYLLSIILGFKKKRESIYFIISITPYTFLAFCILFLFKKKIYLYLRSDGFKEYEAILGERWVFLYKIMFLYTIKRSIIISCHKSLSRGIAYHDVRPSELNDLWFSNRKVNLPKNNIKFLYVGRIRVEKGIFYLLDIFSKINSKFHLTIVGDKKIEKKKDLNISFFYFFDNVNALISQYDLCDIFLLPSYTEAHPKVIDEALSRLKPVIIFEEISHIVEDRLGVFVAKRELKDFLDKVKYIENNYTDIITKMHKNRLPSKKSFIKNLVKIIK